MTEIRCQSVTKINSQMMIAEQLGPENLTRRKSRDNLGDDNTN